jgi:endonuclease III-like uncharacterized protein
MTIVIKDFAELIAEIGHANQKVKSTQDIFKILTDFYESFFEKYSQRVRIISL